MYLMSNAGEIERADHAIFADTGWEPAAVYDNLERLKALDGIPIHTVTAGNLRTDAFGPDKFAAMPIFVKSEDGKISMLRRECTRRYKVAPVQKKCRELGATAKNPTEVWIGISIDESHRMNESRVKYTRHQWPLIDLRMDRNACRLWLEAHGWAGVPKSSCIGCPFHDDRYWRRIEAEAPDEFKDAVAFDKSIRHMPRLRDETFLHRSGMPLDEIDFTEDGQLDMFAMECEGVCGV